MSTHWLRLAWVRLAERSCLHGRYAGSCTFCRFFSFRALKFTWIQTVKALIQATYLGNESVRSSSGKVSVFDGHLTQDAAKVLVSYIYCKVFRFANRAHVPTLSGRARAPFTGTMNFFLELYFCKKGGGRGAGGVSGFVHAFAWATTCAYGRAWARGGWFRAVSLDVLSVSFLFSFSFFFVHSVTRLTGVDYRFCHQKGRGEAGTRPSEAVGSGEGLDGVRRLRIAGIRIGAAVRRGPFCCRTEQWIWLEFVPPVTHIAAPNLTQCAPMISHDRVWAFCCCCLFFLSSTERAVVVKFTL